MVRKFLASLGILLFLPVLATAELQWRETTPAMTILKQYTENISRLLTENGEQPVNSLFANFEAETVMGITAEDDAEIPEEVEITVRLYYDSLNSLELRVSRLDRFPVIAASILKALYGEQLSWADALRIPAARTGKAKENPGDSFEEPVDEMNGTIPRVYYKYEPDPYHNGVSWMQMTIIFPINGVWDGNGLILGTQDDGTYQDPKDEGDPDYEGYFSRDDYVHFETFVTPTPEPDSAAMEYDFR